MAEIQCSRDEKIAQGFSIKEKVFMGGAIYASVLAAAWGISLESVPWAIAYLCFVLFSMVVLIGYANCTHCPYIWEEYKDCLFPPWGKIYRKLFKYRPGKFTPLDYVFFFIFFLGIPLIPQYWLFKNYHALILFWVLYIPTALGFALHACRECQHTVCPFNRSKQAES